MKNTLKRLLMLSFPLLLAVPSCYYNVEEDLYPDLGCDTDGVTYSGTVLPILEANCFSCHGEGINTGNVTLEGYDNLLGLVNSGRFLGAIRHDAGFTPMPQDQPQLPDCTIEKIEAWVAGGALNN